MVYPSLLVSDSGGNIFDLKGIHAAGRSGLKVFPLQDDLVELPAGSQLFFLPDRKAVGYSPEKQDWVTFKDAYAVAAYLSPGYIHTAIPIYEKEPEAGRLPFFSYTAVGYKRGKYYVPAIKLDNDPKHRPDCFDNKHINLRVKQLTKKYPHNRLITHFAENCVKKFGCPNAKNFFMGRWEAPVAVSSSCNASCIGCISEQPGKSTPAPQFRLDFTPDTGEIVEMAVSHLNTAEHAIVSFGQGCEGEPLLKASLILDAIREIRKKTSEGVIHMNTNGSMPEKIEELLVAGLDSIRVSINSARSEEYKKYFSPKRYDFSHVCESLLVAGRLKKFFSVNYFVFPGYTDSKPEYDALDKLIKKTHLPYIQWRNLNIDPDYFNEAMNIDLNTPSMGIAQLIRKIRHDHPGVSQGCTNLARKDIKRIMKKTIIFK